MTHLNPMLSRQAFTQKKRLDLRDILKQHVDANDKLMVMQLAPGWATLNVDGAVTDWLKARPAA